MRFLPVFLVLPALLTGCGDKSAVSLSANVTQATLSVRNGDAGASLSGSFQLGLSLGPEASGSTTVTLGNFSLQSASGAPLVDVLRTLKAVPDFPVEVDKGGSQTVSFSFEEDSVDYDAICAGQVRIVGSVMDTLKGATDPVSSVLIRPDCGAT